MPSYAGQVTLGGPSAVRELDALTIRKCSVGPFDNLSLIHISEPTRPY